MIQVSFQMFSNDNKSINNACASIFRTITDPSGSSSNALDGNMNLAYAPALNTDISYPATNPDAKVNSSLWSISATGSNDQMSCFTVNMFRIDTPGTGTYYYRARVLSQVDVRIYNPQITVLQITP